MRHHLLILAALLLASCTKDANPPPPATPANPCGIVSGISSRDVNGAPVLPPDTTDWRWSDDWCPAVEAMFADRPAVTLNTTAPDSLQIICFPNPASYSQFTLSFYRDDNSYVDIRFVNIHFELLGSIESLTTTSRTINAYTVGVSSSQTVRAYYRVVRPDGSAYRGHGDVKIGV
jgi:hypothetical protein